VITGRKANGTSNSETVSASSGGANTQVNVDAWFNCAGASNTRAGNHGQAQLTAVTQSSITNPDARPVASSPARTTTPKFTNALLAAGNNFAFQNVNYIGAFDPAGPQRQWDSSWTNYNPFRTTYVKHRAGWAMVGLANTPANADKNVIYKNNGSNAFRFSNGYQVDNVLDAGIGYWILLTDNRTIEQVGAPVALPRTVSVGPGWSMFSTGASVPVPVANVSASGTTVQSSYFGFNNGYQAVTVLEPGKAYWVNVSTAGTLTFNP
jgi:hypothetical protein